MNFLLESIKIMTSPKLKYKFYFKSLDFFYKSHLCTFYFLNKSKLHSTVTKFETNLCFSFLLQLWAIFLDLQMFISILLRFKNWNNITINVNLNLAYKVLAWVPYKLLALPNKVVAILLVENSYVIFTSMPYLNCMHEF